MNKSAIGVAQRDGRILVARVKQGGRGLRRTLDASYATRLRATMLVSLGDIATVGATPATSSLVGDGSEPELIDPTAFEGMRRQGVREFHLLGEHGSWTHWSDEVETACNFSIEV